MIKPWRHDKLARLTLTMLHYVRGGFVSLQTRLSPSAVRTTWSTEVAVAESLSTTTQSPATAVTTAVRRATILDQAVDRHARRLTFVVKA